MNDDDVCFASATELARMLRTGGVSASELVDAHLDRIERFDGALRSFVTVCADEARAAARAADEALRAGDDRPLLGVPIAVKDEGGVAGVAGSCGCLALKDEVTFEDALYTQRLRDAGAIVLGTTNLPEFGLAGTTSNRLRGATSTPFAIGMNAGGSSGGSAAAVAAGMATVAHGSDGGGSVRIPAAMCGVVGMIGTYGRVPRVTRPDGFNGRANFPYDGVLARTVADAVLMLSVMAGHDGGDPFSLPCEVPAWSVPTAPAVDGLNVGWTRDLGAFPVEPRVADAVWEAVATLRESGARVVEAEMDLGCTGDDVARVCSDNLTHGAAELVAAMAEDGMDFAGALRDAVDPVVLEHAERGRTMTFRRGQARRSGPHRGARRLRARVRAARRGRVSDGRGRGRRQRDGAPRPRAEGGRRHAGRPVPRLGAHGGGQLLRLSGHERSRRARRGPAGRPADRRAARARGPLHPGRRGRRAGGALAGLLRRRAARAGSTVT